MLLPHRRAAGGAPSGGRWSVSYSEFVPLDVPGAVHVHSGKVRDLYSLESGHLLMVASDRISAYDHLLSPGIPDKGEILTRMSLWWFEQLADLVPNHVVSTQVP